MKKPKIKAEKRDQKNKPKMKISGKSVFKIQEIIIKKSKNPPPLSAESYGGASKK